MEHFMNWREFPVCIIIRNNVLCGLGMEIWRFLRREAVVELEGVGNSPGDPCSAPLDVSYLNELFSERVHIKMEKFMSEICNLLF